jgi:large subunit ribosomal protein L18
MIRLTSKNARRQRIHRRIRPRGKDGTPRLTVFRSLKHIYAQVVDDAGGRTLVTASSLDRQVRRTLKSGGNLAAARQIGRILAERSRLAGIEKVVFDRGGYAYHGRVKALADEARAAGLKF